MGSQNNSQLVQTINYNFFQLLILFGSIQGLIFSAVVIFVKKYRSKSSVFLGLTTFFLSVSNIQHMLMDVSYFSENSIIRKAYIPCQWLVAPFFFLFTYYFLNTQTIKRKSVFYLFSPFFIITIIHSIQLIYQLYFDQDFVITKYYQRGLFLYTNFASFIYIPIVIFFMYRMIMNHENQYRNTNGLEKVKKQTSWLKYLIHIGIGIVALGTLSAILGIIFDLNESFYAYPFFISLSLWIYWVGYEGIHRLFLQSELRNLNNVSIPQKIGLATFIKINDYIIKEKKYLLNDISLQIIAENFELSQGYLSQLINTHANKNFNEYINELRIESSKEMLLDSQFNNYTIESIGLECGFKSKSNFYTTFKKFTGQTPNQFKKIGSVSSTS